MQDEAQLFPGSNHWRAVCGQSRLHGSGGGRRKRTRSTGTSPAAYLTLNVHKDRRLREFIDTQDWITCYFLPAYAPDLNPVEGIWSLLRRSSQANTAFTDPDHLMSALRHGLRHIQYRSNLINGCLTETGLTLTTPRQQSQ
jgi:hypothetical protein